MDDALGQPRVLWSAFTTLLGRGSAPAADAIDAAVFHDFFDNNVAASCDSTAALVCQHFGRLRVTVN
jgi:hypothetical protein